jgi:hypothetical protein
MLTTETKRRIDACRDILVGKLPLPTDQVELITLTLIYKFMDDLDEESVQMGGKRSFFAKDLAPYRWRNLLPQTVSAEQRMTLFAEGIEALGHAQKAAHLPGLFRDGRILTLFLTEVNGFAYSHSEELARIRLGTAWGAWVDGQRHAADLKECETCGLGNAFEYLLQCMGTQGENDQFRTPQNAYVKLRRFLVEDSLVAAVSLPAGVFKPYSGVKTSILLLDKKLARHTREILFLKITADGFDLGDKRTPIEANDLPEAERVVKLWLAAKLSENVETPLAWKAVEKRELLAHSSVSLSAERFFGESETSDSEHPTMKLGEVLSFVGSGVTPKGGKSVYPASGVRFIRSQNVLWGSCDFSDAAFISEEIHAEMIRTEVKPWDVFLNFTGASIGRSAIYTDTAKANVNQHVAILRPTENLLPAFLCRCLLSKGVQN